MIKEHTVTTLLSTVVSAMTPSERWAAAKNLNTLNTDSVVPGWFIWSIGIIFIVLVVLIFVVSFKQRYQRTRHTK